MNPYLAGVYVLGADDVTVAVVADKLKKPQKTVSSGGGNWQTTAGIVLAAVGMVVFAPKIIKWVG